VQICTLVHEKSIVGELVAQALDRRRERFFLLEV